MGLDMESEFEKHCRVGLSPQTVLPSRQRRSRVEKRDAKGKPIRRDDLFSIEEDFTEITFGRYRSYSCKSTPSRPVERDSNIELKRGSVYQSSKEVRKMKKMGTIEGRRKSKMSPNSDTPFSFRIVDSLCSSDEESPKKISSAILLNSDSNKMSISKPEVEPYSSDGFIEACMNLDNREKHSTGTVERDSIEDLNFKCDKVFGPLNDGNGLLEKDTVHTLHKSLSAKVEMPHSPSRSESDHSRASPRAHFSPIRKMFDPFMKSKSLRSPLGYADRRGEVKTAGKANMSRNGTFRKSLLHDFSNTAQNLESESPFVKNDHRHPIVACSPAHLHGRLKLDHKHGVPFFEFSLKCPEDVFVAKTWKAGNAVNWIYTFYSVHSRKKSSASGWGTKDSGKESSMVGQMQVSCYLCSEQNDGSFDNSMVTEFVLYDIAHARKSVASQNCSPDLSKPPKSSNKISVEETFKLDDVSDPVKLKHHMKCVPENVSFDSSTPYPWPQEVLHPDLEIAATVIQVPLEKRESLKYKRGDKGSDKAIPNLLDLSMVDQRKKDISESIGPAKVSVVTPTGNHGLPNTESCGPLPLLDRWRMGGGCDCGGWDMACPLIVFGSPSIRNAENHPPTENQQPLELFVQGAKENTPALTIAVVEEGEYAVDFHARLSTLQAFSICVAILHGSVASTAVGQERNRQLLQCSSLKVFIEEEVKLLIEAVSQEEKRKFTKTKEEIPPSFVLNPPFSPISRV